MKETDLKIPVSNKEFMKSGGKMMIACLVYLRFFIQRIPNVVAQCMNSVFKMSLKNLCLKEKEKK